MNKLTTTLLATALVSTLSMTIFASAATANGPQQGNRFSERASPVRFVCNDKAAERIETGLTRMAARLDLTDAQTTTFETFKTAALSAQAAFAQSCDQFKMANQDQPKENLGLIDRLNNRQAMMGAQLSSMGDVMPEFEAFFTSLTDEQKAQMRPNRMGNRNSHGSNSGPNNGQNCNNRNS